MHMREMRRKMPRKNQWNQSIDVLQLFVRSAPGNKFKSDHPYG